MANNPVAKNKRTFLSWMPGHEYLHEGAAHARDGALWPFKAVHRVLNPNLREAEHSVRQAAVDVNWAKGLQETYKNSATPKATQQGIDDAMREFNRSKTELGFARKQVGSSVKGMFMSFAEVFNIDTSKWHSKKVTGTAIEAETKALAMRGNPISRLISKPFRVAAHHPRIAMGLAALGGIVGIGNMMNNGAAARTQQDTLDTLTAPVPQPRMYQISPEEYATMQARMKGADGVPSGGHADAVLAAKQQPAVTAETAAQL